MISIRPPKQSEKAAWSALFERYLAFYQTTKTQAVYDANWSKIFDDKVPMFAFLATRNDEAVGLAHYLFHDSFWSNEKICYLNDLFVCETARGQGIGELLIEKVKNQSENAGSTTLYWTTERDNHNARRLYDRVGEKTPFIEYQILQNS